MDATIKGYPVNEETIHTMFEKICAIEINDDVHFVFRQIGEIREGDEYTGYRVALTAEFPPMAVPLKLDITTAIGLRQRKLNTVSNCCLRSAAFLSLHIILKRY